MKTPAGRIENQSGELVWSDKVLHMREQLLSPISKREFFNNIAKAIHKRCIKRRARVPA